MGNRKAKSYAAKDVERDSDKAFHDYGGEGRENLKPLKPQRAQKNSAKSAKKNKPHSSLVRSVAMGVRSFLFLDGDEGVPPAVECDPVPVGIFVARSSGLAHFDVVHGMDFPIGGADWSASRPAGARLMRGIKEELAGDAISMSLQAGGNGGIGRVFFCRGIVGFEIADSGPRGGAIVGSDFRGHAVAFLRIGRRPERDVDIIERSRGAVTVHAFPAA